jgi:hypothetical protein
VDGALPASVQTFDGGFVSPYFLPRLDLERYRTLVQSYFPSPIAI